MIEVEKIIDGVDFNPAFNPDVLEYDDRLKFLHSNEGDLKGYVAFGAPFSRRGGMDEASVITPIVDYNSLAKADKTVDKQGKGVGPRMNNTWQAAHGLDYLPDRFGVYVFDILPSQIKDKRQTQGNALVQIARHGGRMIASQFGGLERVVESIHEEYGSAAAVLFTQPPNAMRRQVIERGVPDPKGIPAEFMIIRNAAITLHRIGTVRRRG